MDGIVDYRIVDYLHIADDGTEEWRNTDPEGKVTTDGSRFGQGDSDPSVEDIENSPYVNVGFKDVEGDWHYYWIDGPFDEDWWIDDAIEQIADEYGIVLGEAA